MTKWGPLVYAKEGDAGFDLRAAIPEPIELRPGNPVSVPLGVHFAMPDPIPGFVMELQIRSRSGLVTKHGVAVLNSPGTVDSGYRGEIRCTLHTVAGPFAIEPGMRVAQGVFGIVPVMKFEDVPSLEMLGETSRGAAGFGSTGLS
ncbi:MAG: dUTP diphosphatase [Azospirillum sp.]|nr:dUTP diphosphatase [Azospirillum sp.]